MGLTEKQKRFADYYAQSANATESAKKAGYSGRTAYAIGAENLKKPQIVNYIAEINNKLSCDRIASMQEVKEFWSDVLRDLKQDMKERLKASEFIAKTNAAFIEKVEQTGDSTLTVNFNIPRPPKAFKLGVMPNVNRKY